METFSMLSLTVAASLFVLAAFRVAVTNPRVNLVAAGLFFLTLAFLGPAMAAL